MIIATSIMATIAVATVFYSFGLIVGDKRGSAFTRDVWKTDILPGQRDDVVREAVKLIHDVLWDLRHQIHQLPREWGLPQEETDYLINIYCLIPSGIESIMTHRPMDIIPVISDQLAEKYEGKRPIHGNEPPLDKHHFVSANQGDYAASVYIAKVILSERAFGTGQIVLP